MKKPLSSLLMIVRVGRRPNDTLDPLTGFAGRTQLLLDLERACAHRDEERPRMVVLIDLLGFKDYNDTFGHPAGDALLVRLARNFSQVVAGRGRCYRLDGVEFAAILDIEDNGATLADHVSAAMTEEGEGFAVAPTYGMAVVPHEATTPGDALKIANERMYALRYSLRPGVGTRGSSEVLMEALDKRTGAGDHVRGLNEIVEAVAHQMAVGAEELEQVRLAAALHDVGKAAVPATILDKRFKLDREEREFIERHPQIGERILRAAPALGRVARLVRWSHERFDGSGYPDKLHGEEIPLGSRIIAVCDAFDAMIAPRPYRQPLSPEQAIAELKRCAGTQFDPQVVNAFCAVMEERERFFAAA